MKNKAETPGFRLVPSFRKEKAIETDRSGWIQNTFWRQVVGEIKSLKKGLIVQGFVVL